MIKIMKKAPGVGLAANQIGILKQIVVVNIQDKENAIEKTYALFNPVIKNYSKKVPIGRLGLPTEIAFPALFLAIEASSYITGTTLIVDGGWTSI
jgi:NAD(P)-dependent dehydrogenase (short-subunit alcohol dehydrogenase family)